MTFATLEFALKSIFDQSFFNNVKCKAELKVRMKWWLCYGTVSRFTQHFNVLFRYLYKLGATLCKMRNANKMLNRFLCENVNGDDPKDAQPKKEKVFPEAPTTCCMSGCANCVWLEYAEKLSEYFKDGGERAIKEINERVDDPNIRAFLLQELRSRSKKS